MINEIASSGEQNLLEICSGSERRSQRDSSQRRARGDCWQQARACPPMMRVPTGMAHGKSALEHATQRPRPLLWPQQLSLLQASSQWSPLAHSATREERRAREGEEGGQSRHAGTHAKTDAQTKQQTDEGQRRGKETAGSKESAATRTLEQA
jgi:hypothetical protein